MAKVLVTGAAGFIGSHVARLLVEQGRQVRALVRPGEDTRNLDGLPIEKVTGDILHPAQVADAMSGCDTVYHLAAIYAVWALDQNLLYDVNVTGSANVLKAALAHGVKKVVYTSSIAGIGLAEKGELANEDTPWNYGWYANAYIQSKFEGQLVAQKYAREGLPLVIVNPAFPFGEQDIAPTPTGKLILNVLNGLIPGYIDGGINVIDVRDVAAGHLLAEKKGQQGRMYILGNRNVTIREFYQLVGQASGIPAPDRRIPTSLVYASAVVYEAIANWVTHRPPPITLKSVAVSTRKMFFDTRRAETELGLRAAPIEEALERSISWFRENGYVTGHTPSRQLGA
jgi:dihydroflavonol-4-reductase